MRTLFVLNNPSTCGGRQKTCFKLIRYLSSFHNVELLTDEDIPFLYENTQALKSKTLGSDIIILMSSFNALDVWIDIAKRVHRPFIYSEHCSREYVIKRWSYLKRFNLINACCSVRLHFSQYIEKYYEHKAKIIPNSTKLGRVCRNERQQIILYTGRLNEDPKQISVLLNAFDSIVAKFPDWKLILCGESEQIYGGGKNILILPQSDDLSALYKTSSIFVNPCSSEGFGNSILEALSHSIPCIILDSNSGSKNLVHHEYNGLVSSKEDLALTLERLITDSDFRNYLASNCRASITQYDDDIWLPVWRSYIEDIYSKFK